MLSMLSRNWWVFALRGLIAVIFGILAFIWPAITLLTLVTLFGAFTLVDGVFAVIAGIKSYGEHERWWAVLLNGIAGILVGLITFIWPGMTAIVLVYFIAAWAVVTGVLEIVAAVQLRKVITGEWLMILAGAASIIFGVLLAIFPGAGALSLIWMIALYAIFFGILLIILAFRLRGQRSDSAGMSRASRF